MAHFIDLDRKTSYLLSPSMEDWLPEGHLARFIVEVIEQLDVSRLVQQYTGRGCKAYHPATLLAILFYGYANGVFSSRKLEQATYDSVAFRYLAAGSHPDHDTLANFRRRFLGKLENLFVQVLELAQEMKLLKAGRVCLDGTKIHANASKHQALSHGHIEQMERQLKAEVQELFALAEQADQAAIPDGVNLPDGVGQAFELNVPSLQAADQVDQIPYAASQAIPLPDHQRIPCAELSQRLRRPGRSARAPLIWSSMIFSQPALVSASLCRFRFWSWVDTRA